MLKTDPANGLAALVAVALNAYVLLGGADFGGGVWDLFASGPRRERQRRSVAEALVLALAGRYAPRVLGGLMFSRWAMAWHLATGIAAASVFAALWSRYWRVARVAAALQVSLIFWGWAIAQYPYLVPPDLTIADTAAPPATLRLVLITLMTGAIVFLPSLGYLLHIFKKRSPARSAT
jgi:cytochrome d ubiquinol oxidase subunit II